MAPLTTGSFGQPHSYPESGVMHPHHTEPERTAATRTARGRGLGSRKRCSSKHGRIQEENRTKRSHKDFSGSEKQRRSQIVPPFE